MPAIRPGSSSAASAGRSSSAIRIAPTGSAVKLRNGVPVRLRITRRAISRTSSAARPVASGLAEWPSSPLAIASASTSMAASAHSSVLSIRNRT